MSSAFQSIFPFDLSLPSTLQIPLVSTSFHFPFPYDEIAELNAYGTRAWPHGKVALRLEWAPDLE